jgi:hypothetical protein
MILTALEAEYGELRAKEKILQGDQQMLEAELAHMCLRCLTKADTNAKAMDVIALRVKSEGHETALVEHVTLEYMEIALEKR